MIMHLPSSPRSPTCVPCPACGSTNIRDDYDGLVTSQLGIDYQNGWTTCECGYEGPEINAVGSETDNIRDMVWTAWNNLGNDLTLSHREIIEAASSIAAQQQR